MDEPVILSFLRYFSEQTTFQAGSHSCDLAYPFEDSEGILIRSESHDGRRRFAWSPETLICETRNLLISLCLSRLRYTLSSSKRSTLMCFAAAKPASLIISLLYCSALFGSGLIRFSCGHYRAFRNRAVDDKEKGGYNKPNDGAHEYETNKP
ncbi:hypothetical protein GBA52_012082 [Prunus armeniaca]|nr:hypothetical protein GBA52_011855 [Prunus armeniaca]KAH0984905.1 hypothetical protein GBA52_012082 [Prunus armeniaca]